MAPPVLHRVIHGSTKPERWQKDLITVRPALLQNYRRHKVKHCDYPGILPVNSSGSNASSSTITASVRGTLVTGLTDGDIWRLDIFEGDQYTRQVVKVKLLSDSTALDATVDESNLESLIVDEVDAETYVWCAPREELEEEEWDFEEFKREKMWAWVGEGGSGLDGDGAVDVDSGFADVDRAVKEGGPDGTGGRGVNGAITRELEKAAV